jgi:hypothetical protein
LYLDRLSQIAGDELDTFQAHDFRCTSYFATLAKQDARYKESLEAMMANFHVFPKPMPAGGADEAEPTACKTVGDVFKRLQTILDANPYVGTLPLETDETVSDKHQIADLRERNETLSACSRLSEIMRLKTHREAEKYRNQLDDLGNVNLKYVAADLESMRAPRAREHASAMNLMCEAVRSLHEQERKKRRIGE